MMLELYFMILYNVIYSSIVMATVITIINYDRTVIMTVNYNHKNFKYRPFNQSISEWSTYTSSPLRLYCLNILMRLIS
jgi:hypothetical protein